MEDEYFISTEIPFSKEVESLVEFSGVPKGTHGTVCEHYEAGKSFTTGKPQKVFGVMVNWHRWEGDSLKDGFSKKDYKQFLKEI